MGRKANGETAAPFAFGYEFVRHGLVQTVQMKVQLEPTARSNRTSICCVWTSRKRSLRRGNIQAERGQYTIAMGCNSQKQAMCRRSRNNW